MEERKGAIVQGMKDDALSKDSDYELSTDDLGHPEPSDG
jgi:hypothetical protein